MSDFDFSNSPIAFEEVSESESGRKWESQFPEVFVGEGRVRIGKIKGVFPKNYLRYYERIRDFKTRPDDIWVASFPKCGTTWTQEMVYCIATDLDFESAKLSLEKRFPYLEKQANRSPNLANLMQKTVLDSPETDNPTRDENEAVSNNSFDLVDQMKSPRFIKTHLHYSLLPEAMRRENSPKLIYVARNPRDTCLSFYHHYCLMNGYKGSLDDFVDAFTMDDVFCGPFFPHLKEYWEIRDRKNVLFLTYEDMKKNLPSVIRKTAAFLGKEINDEQVEKLTEHLSFESMRKNPAVNYENLISNMFKLHRTHHDSKFLRKGQVGSYKEEMSPETLAKFEPWIKKNKIDGLYDN